MIPEKKINDFVSRLRAAAGANLESVILFGSAVAGDFHPEFSNINLFCVIRDNSFAALQSLAPAVKWWDGQKQPPPLFMTRDEIDKTINLMIEIKKSGHFRSFWTTFDQSVNLMASGEVVIQSMISPAVTAVRTRGIPCVFQPLREGYRGWGTTLAPMKHLSGLKLDCF